MPIILNFSLVLQSKVTQGSRMHDVVAVDRLSLLNNTYYKDLLCEYGGMLAVANRLDAIHKTPWIGFQSWRTAGRKVSDSKRLVLNYCPAKKVTCFV